MQTYGGVEVLLHAFLTSALDGREWLASRPGCLIPEERTPIPLDRGLDRARLDVEAKIKIVPCRDSNPGRPALSLVTVLTELCSLIISNKTLKLWNFKDNLD
jgi:hypothetical protein